MLVSVCVVCRCECVDACLTSQHLRIQLPHSPLVAIWQGELKLKPPLSFLFIQNNCLWLLSLLSSSSLPLPPHPFCLVFPLGTRERFALITELLFTPAEKDKRHTSATHTAHCHAPSIFALPFMPLYSQCVFVCVREHLLVFNFVKTMVSTLQQSQIQSSISPLSNMLN